MATEQHDLTFDWTEVAADAVEFTLEALSPSGCHVCFASSAPVNESPNNWHYISQGQGVMRAHGTGAVYARAINKGANCTVAVTK